MRITLVFETPDSSRAADRLAENPDYILPCWVHTTLTEAAMIAVEVRDPHSLAVTFDVSGFYPADAPVGPGDVVFAPPIGIGRFSPLVPPSQHGRRQRLSPSAYVERIEQRVFDKKRVSLTRSIAPDAYVDVDLRERAVNTWARDLRYDVRDGGIVELADVDHEWLKVSSENRSGGEAGWTRITDDTNVECDDRVYCVLTVLAMVPTDSLQITYERASADAG